MYRAGISGSLGDNLDLHDDDAIDSVMIDQLMKFNAE
jgi:hypothetical protein